MIKTSATLKRCPKFDSHMQAHCGYATAALGSGPLPLSLLVEIVQPFFFLSLERHFGQPSSIPGAAVC